MLPYSTPPSGGGLYVIRLSDKHYYGGRTVCFATRWADHLRGLQAGTHRNPRMQRVFNLHGRFDPEVVCVLDKDEQTDAEQAWLNANFRKPGCVNLSPHARGGCGGHTDVTRERMRVTRSSRPDLVQKARESLARNRIPVGTPRTPEHKEAIGASLRGRKQAPEAVEKRAASNRGRKNTPDTLRRMSESGKRRAQAQPTSHGDGTRALISSQQRGRVWINNGEVSQRLFPEDAENLLAQGWFRGRLGSSMAGSVTLLDPEGQRRLVRPEDVEARLSAGWSHLPPPASRYTPVVDSQRGHQGTVWVRRRAGEGWECRRVSSDDVDRHLADGWERGGPPRR